MNNFKGEFFITIIGTISGIFTSLFGGWDNGLITLLIFMSVDYISGLILAGVFKKSPKTQNGALASKVGFKGLFKKGIMLTVVLVAFRLDILIGTSFIRDATIIALIVNETISITENAGLMGVPIPKQITNAIDLLKKSGDDKNDKI